MTRCSPPPAPPAKALSPVARAGTSQHRRHMATTEQVATGPRSPLNGKNLAWAGGLAAVAILLTFGIRNGTCPSGGSIWLSYFIYGLRSGAIYAMVALGYTMVYGVLQ